MKRGRFSSRSKLILWLIVPSTILVTAVIWVAYQQTTSFLRQTQDTALNGMVQQVVRQVETQMSDLVLNMLGIEEEIKRSANASEWSRSMETAAHTRPELIRAIVFMQADGSLAGFPEYFWGNFSEVEEGIVAKQAHRSRTDVVWSEPYQSKLGLGGAVNLASIVTKEIYRDDGSYAGVLAFVVDVTSFVERSAVFTGTSDTQTLLYDRHGQLIYSIKIVAQNPLAPLTYTDPNTDTIDRAARYFKEHGMYYVVSPISREPFWQVVVVGEIKTLEQRYRPIVGVAVTVFVLGAAGLIFIYVVVSWWFTRPIVAMTRGIRTISKGQLDYHFPVTRRDEFGEMASEFNRMMRTIQTLIATLKATEEEKRQSDFQVLLSQINPHFLYNTLNTIDMMIDFGSRQQLHDVIRVLTNLLKYGLDRSADLRPLGEELGNARDYLYIQSVRYDNRFEFAVEEPPPDWQETKVLKLILQPIVENAIFHGLHPLAGRKGKLLVSVRREGDELTIVVSDNGVGMEEARVRSLLASFAAPDVRSDANIGLRNVHKRIQLYYGANYGLHIVSRPGEGTVVTLKLAIQVAGTKQS